MWIIERNNSQYKIYFLIKNCTHLLTKIQYCNTLKAFLSKSYFRYFRQSENKQNKCVNNGIRKDLHSMYLSILKNEKENVVFKIIK